MGVVGWLSKALRKAGWFAPWQVVAMPVNLRIRGRVRFRQSVAETRSYVHGPFRTVGIAPMPVVDRKIRAFRKRTFVYCDFVD